MRSVAPAAAVALDQQVHALSAERTAFEAQALGFSYFEVSAALAKLWNFPQSLVAPLRSIADPLAAPVFSAVAATVHLSAWHARNAIFNTPSADIRLHYPHALGERLGLSASWVLPDTEAREGATPRIPELHLLTHGLDDMLN
jgi:HD-like signal output (HDOD) protein